jgi:hypothetical protein
VLGVQEGVSDRMFDAFAAWTETFRVPLHTKLYTATLPPGVAPPTASASETVADGGSSVYGGGGGARAGVPSSSASTAGGGGPRLRIERKHGRAIPVQQLVDEARAGIYPDPCTNTVDMLDR